MRKAYFILFVMLISCKHYTPKPVGYFRINLPKKDYIFYNSLDEYTFNYANCAKIDTYNMDSAWINIKYPGYNATIYLTYKKIHNNLPKLLNETRDFVYKHTIKAEAIDETKYENNEKNTYGILYDIKGNAASPINFFVTDSTKNYIRGALYFYNKPNKDSLAPVIKYIRDDVIVFFESLQWK